MLWHQMQLNVNAWIFKFSLVVSHSLLFCSELTTKPHPGLVSKIAQSNIPALPLDDRGSGKIHPRGTNDRETRNSRGKRENVFGRGVDSQDTRSFREREREQRTVDSPVAFWASSCRLSAVRFRGKSSSTPCCRARGSCTRFPESTIVRRDSRRTSSTAEPAERERIHTTSRDRHWRMRAHACHQLCTSVRTRFEKRLALLCVPPRWGSPKRKKKRT